MFVLKRKATETASSAEALWNPSCYDVLDSRALYSNLLQGTTIDAVNSVQTTKGQQLTPLPRCVQRYSSAARQGRRLPRTVVCTRPAVLPRRYGRGRPGPTALPADVRLRQAAPPSCFVHARRWVRHPVRALGRVSSRIRHNALQRCPSDGAGLGCPHGRLRPRSGWVSRGLERWLRHDGHGHEETRLRLLPCPSAC